MAGEQAEVTESASMHEHLDNPIVMVLVLTVAVLGMRKVMIYAGQQWWPALAGFAK